MSHLPSKARYAAIFASQRGQSEQPEYEAAAARMLELAGKQPGFVDVISVRGADGLGVTISYWQTLDAIRNWSKQAEHVEVQRAGRERWYDWFELTIARVEHRRHFSRSLEDKPKNIERNDEQHQSDDKK